MTALTDFFSNNEALLWWLGSISFVMFIGTLIALPYLISWIPEDYFTNHRSAEDSFLSQHPSLRTVGLILKNVLGIIMIVAGIAMLVLPGQGILTMLIGLMLMNFPGKRALEKRIIRQRSISKAINWLRSKRGKPPLQIPDKNR
jgi:hypothetical protein